MVNFPYRIPGCDSHSPAMLDFFLISDPSICWLSFFRPQFLIVFTPLGNSGPVVFSVSIDFLSNSKGDDLLIAKLVTILMQMGTIFKMNSEMSCGRIFSELVLLPLILSFLSGSRSELMCICLIVIIRSSYIHFHSFELLVLQPELIEITHLIFVPAE